MSAKTNYEIRQSLSSYYEEYAYNALFAANILWKQNLEINAETINFNSKSINIVKSIDEAFRREGSFAIELIVKAAMAYRLKNDLSNPKISKISSSHDITVLWKDAELQSLDAENKRRLIIATQTLYWSGRYGEAARSSKTLNIRDNIYRYKDKRSQNHYVQVESYNFSDVKNIFDFVVSQIQDIK
ncbi:hypothetical protein [Methylobacterium thuringiense]|uniref:hypothetical protein n=1 Tax=Methylobacterium thuringiense TaxID=1003091 RepID=UPI001EDEE43D|nr:hypothetical protein [Methylobacterium thuringiense]